MTINEIPPQARITPAVREALTLIVAAPIPEYVANQTLFLILKGVTTEESFSLPYVEWAAVNLIRLWGEDPFFSKLSFFGLILRTIRDLPEVAEYVAQWDERYDYGGGLDGWFKAYTSPAGCPVPIDPPRAA